MVEQEASTAAKSNAESQVRVDTLFVVLAGITEPQFFKTRERLPFNIPLLPGPLRFLNFDNRNQISTGSSSEGTVTTTSNEVAANQQQTCEGDEEQDPTETDTGGNCPTVPADGGCGTTDATGQSFTFSVSASATMVIEGQKPLLTYVQEGF